MTSIDIDTTLATGQALINLQALANDLGTIEHLGYHTEVVTRAGNNGAIRIQIILKNQTSDRRVGLAFSFTPEELRDLDRPKRANIVSDIDEAVARALNTDPRRSYIKHPMRTGDHAAGIVNASEPTKIEGSGLLGTTIQRGDVVG